MVFTDYRPPWFFFNSHLETIFPALFRKVALQPYRRERITTPDDDFLDLDWLAQGSDHVVVISHGLEGSSSRPYVKGMAGAFFQNGYDVLAWNFRGCSEEINRQLRFYHSGATDDLELVIRHAASRYKKISLIGFSLGGNLTLKYLGEQQHRSYDKIRSATVFSVPMDLHSTCIRISMPANRVYALRFLKSLKKKVRLKAKDYAELETSQLSRINSLIEFDDVYTAPLHGFSDAIDYYTRCSSLPFIQSITVPTLIVNAMNDPFLGEQCYPVRELSSHQCVTFESPPRGGHVGFALFNQNGLYWSELRALEFIQTFNA